MPELIDRDLTLHELEAFKESCIANLMRMSFDDILDVVKEIPTIDAEPVRHGRWIPVEDALPEEDVSVLCYMRIGEIVVMEYGGDGWYCGITRYNPQSVTHWMPLPEPPEKE